MESTQVTERAQGSLLPRVHSPPVGRSYLGGHLLTLGGGLQLQGALGQREDLPFLLPPRPPASSWHSSQVHYHLHSH